MLLALVVMASRSLAGCKAPSQSEGGRYVDLLSSPGKLEIVRQPPAADYTGMPSHGKIESLPSYRPGSGSNWQVDLRSCDLSTLDLRDRRDDLLHADFDSRTIWPARLPEGFDVFWETARKTGVITKIQRDGKTVEFGHVVNPRGLLEALR